MLLFATVMARLPPRRVDMKVRPRPGAMCLKIAPALSVLLIRVLAAKAEVLMQPSVLLTLVRLETLEMAPGPLFETIPTVIPRPPKHLNARPVPP